MTSYFVSIFLLAGSIIAYEIVLVRLFSIAQWHHFAHMVISLALLGFGASGSVIALTQRFLNRHFHTVYTTSGVLYAISAVCCFGIIQHIPFNPFMLVWQPSQIVLLCTQYLILSIPFFFGAVCIGMALTRFNAQVNQLYFFDLMGAGVGAFGIIFAMSVIPPAQNLTLISAIGFLSVLIANVRNAHRSHWRHAGVIIGIGATFTGWLLLHPVEIKISPYKGLNSTLNFPDAEILSTRHSSLGLVNVVRSQSIRAVPGLSLSSQHTIPPQLGLFTDADGMTAIADFDGDVSKLAYLDDTTSAVAYHLLETPRVLVLGAGGGSDLLRALYHNADSIDAVELNPQVVELVEREHGEFAGHIYAPDSPYPVRVHIAEARGFVASRGTKYELIQLALLDSVGASAAGTHALSENYLYTVEAITEFVKHLTEGGIVSITRWLKSPPRDMLKLFATVVAALEEIEGTVPAEQLALIRGWRTGTLLIKNGRFEPHETDAIRRFCAERSFDIAYYPRLEESEANRYNQLDEPIYFRAAQEILFGSPADFYDAYPFYVRPATDNRPYFFQFARFDFLFKMFGTIGRNALPFVEWGYPLLLATLIQATLAGLVLILLPLLFSRQRLTAEPRTGWETQPLPHPTETGINTPYLTGAEPRTGWGTQPLPHPTETGITTPHGASVKKWRVLTYFLCLGVGFMLIEMSFIQKFILLLSYPTYAVAVVLCAFLIFAGLGSLCCHSLKNVFSQRNPIPLAVGALSLIALLYVWMLPHVFDHFLASRDAVKVIVSIGLIGPLAFFMGMPFPLGITLLKPHSPNLTAWAWGINGCASVVSAILAPCLAISYGFNAVILLAISVYLISGWVAPFSRSRQATMVL